MVSPLGSGTGSIVIKVVNPNPGTETSNALNLTTASPVVVAIHISNAPQVVRSDAPAQFSAVADYADGSSADITGSAAWLGTSAVARITSSGKAVCNHPGPAGVTATLGSLTTTSNFVCVLKQLKPFAGFSNNTGQFDGPFASWVNVKSFGAVGDGTTDDTLAIQAAIAVVQTIGKALYFPHGTYAISRTLQWTSGAGFSVIGEDPRTTAIVWHGAALGTMLSFNGDTGFRVTRLTVDGSSTAAAGIYIASTFADGQLYPTRDAIEDSTVKNCGKGVQLGFAGETTISRVHFDHNTVSGISLENFNALNFNVIDSLFTDNAVGLTNDPGAGAYNVSNSVFLRSTIADMIMGNTGNFSIRQNISSGSRAFFVARNIPNGPTLVVQGNTIVSPIDTPFQIGNPGPLMLADNVFRGMPASASLVASNSSIPLGIFSVGNEFTSNVPFTGNLGTVMSYDESAVETLSTADVTVPSETYVPSASGRAAIEVPTGATSGQIQTLINSSAQITTGATIHFPAGTFNIDATLQIPAASGLKLIGDGDGTVLAGSNLLTGPVMHLGNSVHVEDLVVLSKGAAGIQVAVDDSPSTRVFCDLCKTVDGQQGISVENMDHAAIAFRATINGAARTALSVSGGSTRAAGFQTLGRVDAYMTTSDFYTVGNNGHLLIEDGFHDGGQGPLQFSLSGSGVVTQQGGAIYGGDKGMNVTGYTGLVSILGLNTSSVLSIDSTSQPAVMIAGVLETGGAYPVNDNSNGTTSYSTFNYSTINNQPPTQFTPSSNTTTMPAATVEKMLAQTLTEYVAPRYGNASDTTEVVLHRLLFAYGNTGLQVMPAQINHVSGAYTISASQDAAGSATAPASCAAGTLSMAGSWALQSGDDGAYGLKTGSSSMLSNSLSANVSVNLGLASTMTDAGQRWSVQPAGDGYFKIISRADGSLLTRSGSGCANLSADLGTNASQEWRLTVQ